MSKVVRQIGFDEGAYVAREKEDVIVGGEIIRHRLSSRVIHWAVALTFLCNVVTGLPIWSPVFGWMATLVGGLSVARVIHPWCGLFFALASLAMAVHWWSEMEMTKEERGWVGPKLLEYLRDRANHDKIGTARFARDHLVCQLKRRTPFDFLAIPARNAGKPIALIRELGIHQLDVGVGRHSYDHTVGR